MVGNTRAFDPHKEPGALKAYFKTAKHFIAYLSRMGTGRSYHFSANGKEEGTHRPEGVIELSDE